MKKINLFLLILLLSVNHMQAGLYDYFWPSSLISKCQDTFTISPKSWFVGTGFFACIAGYFAKNKAEQRHKELVREQLSELADSMIVEECKIVLGIKQQSVADLHKQLEALELSSDYLDIPKSKIYLRSSIFHVPEVEKVIQNLDEKKEELLKNQKSLRDLEINEDIPDLRSRTYDDTDIKELGIFQTSTGIQNAKWYRRVWGYLDDSGHKTLKISIRDKEKKAPAPVNVGFRNKPTADDLTRTSKFRGGIIIGREQADGTFAWQKINSHIDSSNVLDSSDNVKKSTKKVQFTDTVEEYEVEPYDYEADFIKKNPNAPNVGDIGAKLRVAWVVSSDADGSYEITKFK